MMRLTSVPRPTRLLGLVVGLLALYSCSGDLSANPDDEASIATLLGEYLPRLAESYRSGDPSVLEGYAAEKEIAGMRKRIGDLLLESREIRPTFQGMKLEDAHVWSHANAYATTLETWDLAVYASGTDVVLSHVEGQRSRVKYQLKRYDGSWIVMFRQIDTVFE